MASPTFSFINYIAMFEKGLFILALKMASNFTWFINESIASSFKCSIFKNIFVNWFVALLRFHQCKA